MADTSRPEHDPAAHDPAADPAVTLEDEQAIAQTDAMPEDAAPAKTPGHTTEKIPEAPEETSVPGFEFPGDRAKQQRPGKGAGLWRGLQWLSLAITLPFLALNGLAVWQVRSLMNYSESDPSSPPLFAQPPLKRLGAFAFGVKVPRPQNKYSPADLEATFESHRIDLGDGEFLEGWYVPVAQTPSIPEPPAPSESPAEPAVSDEAASSAPVASATTPEPAPAPTAQQAKKQSKQGIVLLFPAYAASKQTLLQEIKLLRRLGYASFAVDPRGVGDSSGSDTTLGRREAADVAAAVDYVTETFDDPPIALYGRLLGAGYIMRAVAEFDLQPQALIIEDPPAQLFSLTQAAVESVGLPRSPTTQMLTFWGGVFQQGESNAYDPINYAAQITVPTLVLYGSEDSWVSLDEVVGIHSQLQGQKEILGLPADRLTPVSATAYAPWLERVGAFLDRNLSEED